MGIQPYMRHGGVVGGSGEAVSSSSECSVCRVLCRPGLVVVVMVMVTSGEQDKWTVEYK